MKSALIPSSWLQLAPTAREAVPLMEEVQRRRIPHDNLAAVEAVRDMLRHRQLLTQALPVILLAQWTKPGWFKLARDTVAILGVPEGEVPDGG